jgi:uncharacterized membrane protein
MNKEMYLASLKQNLVELPTAETLDIIRDQEEYFRDALAAGRNESEVIKSLGDPKQFALSLRAESKIFAAENSTTVKQQIHSTLGAVIAILALAPLNLIFVFGPFMGLIGVTIAGWAVAGAILISCGAIFVIFLTKTLTVGAGFWGALSAFFLALAVLGLGLLAMATMYKATSFILKGTIAYLKWNLNFIKARA